VGCVLSTLSERLAVASKVAAPNQEKKRTAAEEDWMRHRPITFFVGLFLVVFCALSPVEGSSGSSDTWEERLLLDLCKKYLNERPQTLTDPEERPLWLDRLTRHIGRRLAESGTGGATAEDVAMLALLQARSASPEESREHLDSPQAGSRPSSQQVQPENKDPSKSDASQYGDISKGEEGYVQAVERFAELPVSERLVMTGGITAGIQAATVSGSPNLTSTFGRARINFVARATPATVDGRLSEGYFFAQLVAAGGPFDASAVDGPSAFSPFNDVATDRSRFNEGLSRGNVYVGKVFYQQEARIGDGYLLGRAGVIDFSDYFDANEFANNEARQFLNAAFVNSVAFKGAVSAPGFMTEYNPGFRQRWLQDAVFRVGYGISRIERAFTSPLWSLEAELKPWLRGYRGSWRLGGTIGNVAGAGAVRGLHLSVSQWIAPQIGLYGRFAVANSSLGSLILGPARQSYSGGLQWRILDREDRVSAWGLGFSQAWGIETDEPLGTERVFETYYRWQLADNFSLTPDLQFVLGSGGRLDGGTHFVFGLRTNFDF
jgi:hypothetical protein